MISRLRGVLVARTDTGAVIEATGVGYEVNLTPDHLASLPDLGAEVVVHTHLVVRDDLMALYGFAAAATRDTFRILLGASGVGPALAMATLATLRPDELRHAVSSDDVGALVAVPGIGKRKAEKLLLDLRPKLGTLSSSYSSSSEVGQVREALESLGYQPVEIREVLEGIPRHGGVETMLRNALKALGGS